jgi:hypothetical protein
LRERKKEREKETELRVTKETKCQKAIHWYFIGIKNKNGILQQAQRGVFKFLENQEKINLCQNYFILRRF